MFVAVARSSRSRRFVFSPRRSPWSDARLFSFPLRSLASPSPSPETELRQSVVRGGHFRVGGELRDALDADAERVEQASTSRLCVRRGEEACGVGAERRPEASLNSGSRGRHRCRGRRAPGPKKIRLALVEGSTVSGTPVRRASCCTSAVFPVPVSPGSRLSALHSAPARFQDAPRVAMLDQKSRSEPAPEPPASAGNVARPSATAPFAHLSLSPCPVVASPRAPDAATRVRTRMPGPGWEIPQHVGGFFVRRRAAFRRQRVTRRRPRAAGELARAHAPAAAPTGAGRA